MKSFNFETLLRRTKTFPIYRWRLVHVVGLLLFFFFFLFLRSKNGDIFDQPFCDADGTCHEQPYVASPRTVFSAWNKKQYDLWWKYFEALQDRVKIYEENRQAGHSVNTRPLIFLGDSITEAWSGTGLGEPKHRARGVPEVLAAHFHKTSGLDPIILGASGDQTQHLLYRLQNGHMRAAQIQSKNKSRILYDPSAIFVVMIGTNNLGSGEMPEPTARGILAVVEYLLKETADAGCHVIVFKVLPRGDNAVLSQICPPRCQNNEEKLPLTSFLPSIETVNDNLDIGLKDLNSTYSSRIQLIDCNSQFLNKYYNENKSNTDAVSKDRFEVDIDLMPDLLHPNDKGHEVLAKYITEAIDQI